MRSAQPKAQLMTTGLLDAFKRPQQSSLRRKRLGVQNRFVGVLDVRRGKRPAVVKGHVSAQIEKVGAVIEHAPMVGQFRLQSRSFVVTQQRIVNQITDAYGIGVGRIARIELQRVALDAGDKISRRALIGRRAASATNDQQ